MQEAFWVRELVRGAGEAEGEGYGISRRPGHKAKAKA